MSNALENYKKYPNLTEVYEVVQTVQIVFNRRTYRIDVVKYYSNPPIHYEVLYWELVDVNAQPSYPSSGGKFERRPENMRMLVPASFSSVTNVSTAEDALRQALHWICNPG